MDTPIVKLKMAVIRMVIGMRNSMIADENRITSSAAKARLIQWPMVNAVAKIATGFQSLKVKGAHIANKNSM